MHLAAWPQPTALGGDPELIVPVVDVLTQVRRAKTEAKRSQRWAVDAVAVTVEGDAARSAIIAGAADLREAGSIADLDVVTGGAFTCDIRLAAE